MQAGQPLSSPAATDATMAYEEANEAVSVHSSSSESPTIPSAEQPKEDDARMEENRSHFGSRHIGSKLSVIIC